MADPVLFFEVTGRDGDRLRSFYSDLFDWRVDAPNPMRYGYVEPADGGVANGIGQAPDGSPGQATFHVGTPDITASLARAEALGGRTILARTQVDDQIVISMLADPEAPRPGPRCGHRRPFRVARGRPPRLDRDVRDAALDRGALAGCPPARRRG